MIGSLISDIWLEFVPCLVASEEEYWKITLPIGAHADYVNYALSCTAVCRELANQKSEKRNST